MTINKKDAICIHDGYAALLRTMPNDAGKGKVDEH